MDEQNEQQLVANEQAASEPELMPLVITVPTAGLFFSAPDGRPLFSIGEVGEGDQRQVHAVLYSPVAEPKIVMMSHAGGGAVHFLADSEEVPLASVGAAGESGFFSAMNVDGSYAISAAPGDTEIKSMPSSSYYENKIVMFYC